MFLVSIVPFAVRRVLLLVAAFSGLSIATCFADSLFVTAKKTPYDHQMARIQPVLNAPTSVQHSVLPVSVVNQWMHELRAIPYSYSMEWKTPNEIAHSPAADCKGKAVALYQRMRENGARNLRLIIGKRTRVSRSTHTWVEWTSASVTFVLDPTINWVAQVENEMPEHSYVPYYAFDGSRKYRAAAAAGLYARL